MKFSTEISPPTLSPTAKQADFMNFPQSADVI